MSEAKPSDELYVGYLPVPARQKRFLRWAVPAALWTVCGVGLVWSRSQPSPGPALWDQASPVTLHGTLAATPYPVLFAERPDGGKEAVLLVEMGKHGGRSVAGLDGRRVTATGWPLHREGRRILELEPGDQSVCAAAGEASIPEWRPLGVVTLRGEIVDSKCFLGAMKPGEGKTHKECATLCIRGGIPPMLATFGGEGPGAFILLIGGDDGPISPDFHPLIGDTVEASGELFDWGGLRLLRLKDAKRL